MNTIELYTFAEIYNGKVIHKTPPLTAGYLMDCYGMTDKLFGGSDTKADIYNDDGELEGQLCWHSTMPAVEEYVLIFNSGNRVKFTVRDAEHYRINPNDLIGSDTEFNIYDDEQSLVGTVVYSGLVPGGR